MPTLRLKLTLPGLLAVLSATAALLLFTPKPAQAAPLALKYKLPKPLRVSLNIYDAKGQVVRELMHAAPRLAGAQTELWDGKDESGQPVPAGQYSWKLLATPGLNIQYLLTVGSSFPEPPEGPWWAMGPGCHGGPRAVAADATGIYVSAFSENIETTTLKLSPDGKRRLWSAKCPAPWEGGSSMAVIEDTLYVLTVKTVWPYDAATGARKKALDVVLDGEVPSDLAVSDTTLALTYPKHGIVRWLDPTGGKELANVPLPLACSVTSAPEGGVYAVAADKLFKVGRAGTSKEIASNLIQPGHIRTISDGSLLVSEAGTSNRLRHLAADGKTLGYYGAEGGRQDGLYTPEARRSFSGVSDIAPLPNGGFLVAEAEAAPRRVAQFDVQGNEVNEWCGGQIWAPWITPEPDNPNAVWMASQSGSLMRCLVDYATGTWKVHSTYRVDGLANGLIPRTHSLAMWETRIHNGELYLCRAGDPAVIRVDRKNWRLIPCAVVLRHLQFTLKNQPPFVKEIIGTNDGLSWTDANGDGQPQSEEIRFQKEQSLWTSLLCIDGNLNYLAVKNGEIYQTPVEGWNQSGSPIYGSFPSGNVVAKLPTRAGKTENRWGAFHYAQPDGTIYSAINADVPDWGKSKDSFLVKFAPGGQVQWTVGKLGTDPGQIGAFRRIAGEAKGCIVVNNFGYEWETERFPRSYLWDADGLYVGGLFENPDLKSTTPWHYALGAESLAGVIREDPKTGEVLYFGHWINEGRIFRVTGWDGWQRAQGTLQVKEPLTGPSVTPRPYAIPDGQGDGLNAEYFTNDKGEGTPIIARKEASIDIDWGKIAPPGLYPAGQNGPFGVRWTGFIQARATGWHWFRLDSASPYVTLNVAGTPLTNSPESPPIWMEAGRKYPVQAFYTNTRTHPVHTYRIRLLWAEPGWPFYLGQKTVPATQLYSTAGP